MWKAALILLMTGFLAGCDDLSDYEPEAFACENEMAEVRQTYGSPEEVYTYDSGGYHSVSWWYWGRGVNFDFAWGRYVAGCDVSTYTFPPL